MVYALPSRDYRQQIRLVVSGMGAWKAVENHGTEQSGCNRPVDQRPSLQVNVTLNVSTSTSLRF
jgi:hypothetical protein